MKEMYVRMVESGTWDLQMLTGFVEFSSLPALLLYGKEMGGFFGKDEMGG